MSKPDNPIIHAMLQTDFYPHPVDVVRLIETHISWVFLTGSYAYKVKKPVDFGFLDFSTLERRKYFCEEELRLNQRLAAEIYLDVLPITRTDNAFQLNGHGQPVEYTVRMKEFGQQCLLDQQLQKQAIKLEHIDALAETIAHFHQHIIIADTASPFGSTEELLKPVQENLAVLHPRLKHEKDTKTIERLQQQTTSLHQQLAPVFSQRKQQGFIRECHGDLHLGNIALIDNRMVLFDGIEFNDSFRWIDVMSDLAFLVMDLQDYGEFLFANHLLNHYLEITGDYSGLRVMKFYQLYRAMVRAKVAALRMEQQQADSSEYNNSLYSIRNYLVLAASYLQKQATGLIITHGISGSGKSWLTQQLADKTGAIRIRSDVERKRMYNLDAKDSSRAAELFIYDSDSTEKTYQRLAHLAALILEAGYSVIVDATFLDARHRQAFRDLAASLNTDCHILHCHANHETLKKRISQRQIRTRDASEADMSIMEKQQQNYQPLSREERKQTLEVDTGSPVNIDELGHQLKIQQ